jgi:hypothetical protein
MLHVVHLIDYFSNLKMNSVFTNYTVLQLSHRCEKLKEAMHFVSICLRVRWRYFAWNVKQFSNWTADSSGGHKQVNAFPQITAHYSARFHVA